MANPTLFLHIGAGKTGTSYLQSQIVLQQEAIAAQGLWFPVSPQLRNRVNRGLVTSGNTTHLLPFFCPDHPVVKKRQLSIHASNVQEWLEKISKEASGKNILLSSETLQHAKTTALKLFKDFCEALGYDVKIIYYVRHAIDHAISNYKQMIQTGNLKPCRRNCNDEPNINYWLANRTIPYRATLTTISEHFSTNEIAVRSYDAERKTLLQSFMAHLEIELNGEVRTEQPIVNRSLTPSEIRFLEEAASRGVTDEDIAMLGDRILRCQAVKSGSNCPKHFRINPQVIESFSANHEEIVNDINHKWADTLSTPLKVIPENFINEDKSPGFNSLYEVAMRLITQQIYIKGIPE